MAKVSGLVCSVTLDDSGGDGRDISNDITSITVSTKRGLQEITGLDSEAVERLVLLADFTGTINGVFNADANMSHAVLSTCTTSEATRTMVITYADAAATLTAEVVIENYDLDRGDDGKLTWSSNFSLADGTAAAWT